MADKDTRVGKERIGRPVDELVTGRAPGAGDRPGDYTTSEFAAGATPGTSRKSTSSKAVPDREPNSDTRARELRAEIEETREDMSETVNAIQDRLRPGNIASNAAESIRETAAERTRDIVESEPVQYVRANPIPTAMIGIGVAGLAWLTFGGRDADDYRRSGYGRPRNWRGSRDYAVPGASYRTRSPYGGSERADYGAYDADSGAYGAYGREDDESLTDRLGDRAGEMADDVRERAQHATRQARQKVRRAQTGLQRTWNENPLLIGAASAVLGALVALSVPETEVENEWMGERRDQMIEGVQEAVREKVEDVQNAATDAANTVKDAVGIHDDNQA
ncbi:DUF3618 domain-containing protein [soil metagenome]|nr:DUF3618 domain-containing protein [Acidobacteriota bacterium]